MQLFCPGCNLQHIDKGEWATKPHKRHLCEGCGLEWRPFDFATVAVAAPSPVAEATAEKDCECGWGCRYDVGAAHQCVGYEPHRPETEKPAENLELKEAIFNLEACRTNCEVRWQIDGRGGALKEEDAFKMFVISAFRALEAEGKK